MFIFVFNKLVIMKKRYFYRLGRFIDPIQQNYIDSQRKGLDTVLDGFNEENNLKVKVGSELNKISTQILDKFIPKEFNHFGHDIRTWTPSNIFKEMDKDNYVHILEDEEKIIKDLKSKNDIIEKRNESNNTIYRPSLLKTDGWHFPIEVEDNGDVESQIKEKFNIKKDIILEQF